MYILVFGILILFIIIVNIKHKKVEINHAWQPWRTHEEFVEFEKEFERMRDPLYRKARKALGEVALDAELAEYKKTDSADMHRMRRHMYGKNVYE